MKIISYNIQFATGRDAVVSIDRIADEVRGADIICLQEVDRFWPRSNNVDQVAEFRSRFPGYFSVYGPGVSIGAMQTATDGQFIDERHEFGNMTLSRWPILYSRHHLLPKYASTGPISIQRSAIECVIDTDSGPLRIFNTHLTHLSAATRLPQVQRLLEIHETVIREGTPVCGDLEQSYWKLPQPLSEPSVASMVMGDFNMEPDSREYTMMTGPVSDYGGRIINPERFVDVHDHQGMQTDQLHTSDVHGRPARLDYIFASPVLTPRITGVGVDHDATGSDHQPIWVEME